MFILLKAGLVDYSYKIVEGTYKVDKEAVTYNWEDGNYKEHQEILRTRTAGSFKMKFFRWSDYVQFLSDMALVKSGTEYALTVYATNTNEQVSGNFFVKISPELREKSNLTFTPGEITVTIREA